MTVRVWLHGLLAAFIGGGGLALANASFLSWLAPDKFNLKGGEHLLFKIMALTFVTGGIMAAGAYLAKSPLPEKWNNVERRKNVH